MKYFNNEEHEAQRYDISLRRKEEANIVSYKMLAVLNVGQSAIIALGVTTLMFKAAAGVVAGSLTVGDLVLVNAYLLQMAMPLNYLGMMYRGQAGADQHRAPVGTARRRQDVATHRAHARCRRHSRA